MGLGHTEQMHRGGHAPTGELGDYAGWSTRDTLHDLLCRVFP